MGVVVAAGVMVSAIGVLSFAGFTDSLMDSLTGVISIGVSSAAGGVDSLAGGTSMGVGGVAT